MTFQTKRMMILAVSAAGMQVGLGEVTGLRELSTDRPDVTESPYTVDKGHFQMELEMASATIDGSMESYGFLEANLKYGVAANTDIQFVIPFFEHEAAGSEGFGDIQIRLKHNLWGNDEGDTALAIMPFLQVPTGNGGVSSGEVEGGIILPLGIEGPNGWGYGFQIEADLVADAIGSGHHFSLLASATAARALTEKTGFFVEAVGIAGEGSEATTEAYFNTGLTWAPEGNLQFDAGVRVGLTSDSDDLSPFFGVSLKF